MKISVARRWRRCGCPALALNLGAGSALARGYMRIAETAHYELLTMEIYTRALRCAVVPGQDRLQGDAEAGRRRRRHCSAVRKLHLVLALHASLLGGGTVHAPARPVPGVGPLPDLPGIAAVVVPLLGADRAAAPAAHARCRRPAAASGGSSTASRATRPAHCFTAGRPDTAAAWSTPAPPASAWSPTRRSRSARSRAVLLRAERRRGRGARGRRRGRGALLPRGRRAASWSARRSSRSTPPRGMRADGVVLRRLQPPGGARDASGRAARPRPMQPAALPAAERLVPQPAASLEPVPADARCRLTQCRIVPETGALILQNDV